MSLRIALAAFVLGAFVLCHAADERPKAVAVGDKTANSGSLRDLRGNRRALHDFKGNKAIVLAFVGAECPVSNLYLPGLVELEKKFRKEGVQFLAVYPNHAEDLDQIAGHAYDRGVAFPVLKDVGQKLADSLGVTRVPTVVVLDGEFTLRYRGRVNDQYGVAARRPKPTREDLALALDEVLAGKKIAVAETEADGCLISRALAAPLNKTVTYTRDVAPILQNRCQMCHRPDQTAPFSLLTYDDAAKHGRMIKEVTEQRRMPPWHADPRYGHWANDRRLSKAEVETIAAWVDGGMAKGDPKHLPEPIAWAKGWTYGQPDMVFEMPEEFEVPATGVVPYKNWFIETKFAEDRWIRMAECRPGTPGVVHHIVAYIMKEGQRGPVGPDGSISILVGWAPGDLGLKCPPDTALRVPKGARLRLEMHYTPNGTVTKDKSSVGVWFAKEPPKYELFLSEFANTAIAVPPHDPHYKAEATFRVRYDARLISLTPHMHWRGKDYHYEIIYPDGKKETILSVPRWDFNWQSVYRFKEPLKLPQGSRLHAVAHWDNSKNNLLNPAPQETVRFGLQSWEEMMVGFAAYVWERPETVAELAKNPLSQNDLLFERFDTNGDEAITPDEIPDQIKGFAPLMGITIPQRMTRPEFAKFMDEVRLKFKPKPKPDADK
jgi:peroxiredoxin